MCERQSPTLARVLRSLKAMTPAGRAEVRRVLNEAPEPPSLGDAIRNHRGLAGETTATRNARIRAAIAPAPVE
jgi:hypothetical protein